MAARCTFATADTHALEAYALPKIDWNEPLRGRMQRCVGLGFFSKHAALLPTLPRAIYPGKTASRSIGAGTDGHACYGVHVLPRESHEHGHETSPAARRPPT